MTKPAPVTERRYIVPLAMVTSLFFVWAIGVNLNDVLIQHLKKAFGLTDFQSSLIQSAFFGAYALAALPAGWLMQRIGYKRGILTGLLVCATGTILFIPAASVRVYAFFLFALFVMACGQSVLEVAANPYATTLGPVESAERRLNLAQSFNATGAFLVVLLGSRFILSGIEYTPAQLAAMSPAQLLSYRMSEANMVKSPYIVITGIFLFIAVLIFFTKLPEIHESTDSAKGGESPKLGGTLGFPHLLRGVVAQFFYVGAQVGVASFIIRFSEFTLQGAHEKIAARFLQAHVFGFMMGRFIGSAIMRKVSPSRLLSVFAAGSLLCVTIILLGSGVPTVAAIVLLGFFHSIMFPTIFALSIKNLGPYTKLGSSLLVMSIIGGAVCPAIMGRVSDAWNIQRAFLVPLLCHAYVFYFAMRGYRPSPVTSAPVAIPAREIP
ncbi:MAG TPA: L-fucose:H+ symporter permease [Candidatus Dormibacteraeota bacterium]|nr:L-fucose:H+ symporter permease [Candidatus Dormibacteraeota bacterium]